MKNVHEVSGTDKSASWKPRVRTGIWARKQAAEGTVQKQTLRSSQAAFDCLQMRPESIPSDILGQTSISCSTTLLGMRVGE